MSTSNRRLAFPARNLCFTSVDGENRLQVTFSQHCRAAEFTLTDDQVVLLWELLGDRVGQLARRRDAAPTTAPSTSAKR